MKPIVVDAVFPAADREAAIALFRERSRYCVDWDPAPTNSCTSIAREGGAMMFVDAETGASRGTVVRIEPGDPEGFGG